MRHFSLLLLLAACATVRPIDRTADEAEVRACLDRFLRDFENLRWDPFRATFTDDACVFFPSAATPETKCGREAVEARFSREFDSIRAGAPPYMKLEPQNLTVRSLSNDTVLVHFMLENKSRIARRTMVFVRQGGEWRITHLHASNVPWPD